MAVSISPSVMVLDVTTTFSINGTGLSRADRMKLIEPSALCRGMDASDALIGGDPTFIEWTKEDRSQANVTFTIRRLPLSHDEQIAAIVCYLYDGSSEYTRIATINVVSNPTWWPEDERPVDPTYGLHHPQHQYRHDGRLITRFHQDFDPTSTRTAGTEAVPDAERIDTTQATAGF